MRAGLILSSFIFFSCNKEARKLQTTQEYLFNHPDYAASFCAEQFPVKDSVIVRDSISYDTIYFEPDTIIKNGEIIYLDKNCPIKTVIKTFRKDSVIWKRDYAEERRLQLALQSCQLNSNDLVKSNLRLTTISEQWKDIARKRLWWLILLIALITGGFAGWIYFKTKKLKLFT
jgi:hypothetical protein